ncbi:hypothetical protein ABZX39_33555 [Streptomyces collinus]|uniref:hypothetical protein n=1 Tax=Streptomyces collinus TaxID=42684 RepID=UPI0033BBB01A
MASNPASAAAPGPNTPPHGAPTPATTGTPQAPQTGGIAGLLAPVQPVRTAAFNLNPASGATPTGAGTAGATSASSSTFHATQNTQDNGQNTPGTGTGGKQQQGVIRTWMLALAYRHQKAADARIKALDIKKARAQALQVKESRTVNRSEKIVGGNTNTGSSTQNNSGKSLNSKSSNSGGSGGSGGSGKGPGRSNGGGHGSGKGSGHGGGGAGGRNNHGSSGSGSGGGGTSRSGNGSGHGGKHNGSGHGSKGPGGGKGPAGSSGSSGASKTSKTNAGGGTAPKQPSQGAGSTTSGSGGSGTGGGSSKTLTPNRATPGQKPNGSQAGPARVYSPGNNSGRPWRNQPQTAPNSPTSTPQPNTPTSNTPGSGGKSLHKPTPVTQPGPPAKGPGNGSGKGPVKAPAPTPRTAPQNRHPRPLKTQGSRETGYRDGVRAGLLTNHVKAYGHGLRDGYIDATAAGQREKTRMDKARAARQQPTPSPAPKPQVQKVPPMPTTPPTNNRQPQPIQVTSVTTDGVNLGAGADRPHLRHGEVRTLKGYERKIKAKADIMTRIADGARVLQAHAEEQLKQATWYAEQARAVQGGDKLLPALLKLQEEAVSQAKKAGEIVRRAVRANEACQVLITNVDTRYGSIYKAVVDSGLIKPALLHYYKDTANA